MLKRRIAEILRKLHLLQMADSVLLAAEWLNNRSSNRAFKLRNPDFKTPPARLAYDAYNHINWQNYHDMGRRHAELIADLIKEGLHAPKIKVLEWGCGPARVIRHLKKIDGFDEVEIAGADYNEASIAWCRSSVSGISFVACGLKPPLPGQGQQYDCVYAISVFTHLSEEMHDAWIEELFRVLKPNGILIFTTQGQAFRSRLLKSDQEKFDAGQLVIKAQVQEGKKHFSAFHPPEYVRSKLLKGRTVVRHIETPTRYWLEQDVWVAKSRDPDISPKQLGEPCAV